MKDSKGFSVTATSPFETICEMRTGGHRFFELTVHNPQVDNAMYLACGICGTVVQVKITQ